MISRNDVVSLYRLVLDRDPESEDVVNEKRRSSSASDVAFEMLASGEFVKKNEVVLRRLLDHAA